MNKQRITNLIGAGTMVALVVAIGLLLGGNRPNVSADSAAPTAQIDTLQAENDALQQAVTTYQQREAVYASQIERANELLAQQGTTAPATGENAGYDDGDEYEEHHEAHENHYEHDEDDD